MLKVLCTAINYNTPLCRAMCDCYLVLLFSISAEDFLLLKKSNRYEKIRHHERAGRRWAG